MQCMYHTNVFGLDNFESKLKKSLEKQIIVKHNIQHVHLLLSYMRREFLTGIKNGIMCNMVSSVGRLLIGRGWDCVNMFQDRKRPTKNSHAQAFPTHKQDLGRSLTCNMVSSVGTMRLVWTCQNVTSSKWTKTRKLKYPFWTNLRTLSNHITTFTLGVV